jgi:hypothetical protein
VASGAEDSEHDKVVGHTGDGHAVVGPDVRRGVEVLGLDGVALDIKGALNVS